MTPSTTQQLMLVSFDKMALKMHSRHVPCIVNNATNERERAKLEEKHRVREKMSAVWVSLLIGTRL